MEIDTKILFQLIGELEVLKKIQTEQIAFLEKQLAGLTETPTPIREAEDSG